MCENQFESHKHFTQHQSFSLVLNYRVPSVFFTVVNMVMQTNL